MNTTMQAELLAQIAKLPNTTVAPYPSGGGVHIIEQLAKSVRFRGVWLNRPRTVQYLQEYLQSRAAIAENTEPALVTVDSP